MAASTWTSWGSPASRRAAGATLRFRILAHQGIASGGHAAEVVAFEDEDRRWPVFPRRNVHLCGASWLPIAACDALPDPGVACVRFENSKETKKMNISAKTALATAFFGLLLGASPAALAEQSHYVSSNAVDKCQAFTPGVTNTIRNRVAGAENVGTQPIAVACTFELAETYGFGNATVDSVEIFLKNGSAAEVTISCTLLPGTNWAGDGVGTLVTQSVTLASGASGSVEYDTGGPWDVFGIGVNCNLPPQGTIQGTVIRYRNDA
ncbi:MAG: hypothetical protein QM719_00435 [Thermomonas sp.]